MQRRLAAILFADIAGYSRLMDEHEVNTHQRLMRLLKVVVEPAISEGGGQIVKNTGDGFLARFDSVSDAFECAVAIQRGINSREAGEPAETRIGFRMGLHVGDIEV